MKPVESTFDLQNIQYENEVRWNPWDLFVPFPCISLTSKHKYAYTSANIILGNLFFLRFGIASKLQGMFLPMI